MTTTYELYTNENGTPKAVEGKAPAIIERVEALKTEVTQGLAGKAPTKHTHTSAQVTDLSTTLAPYAKTTAVNTGLAGKASKTHTHKVSQITDMPKVVFSVNGVTPNDSGNVSIQAGIELVRW